MRTPSENRRYGARQVRKQEPPAVPEPVREAAVIGVPCAYRGETVKAIVSLRDAAGLTIENLRLFLADLLSPMEIPKLLEIVDEIPRNENLKISRLALREREARRREG